MKSRKKGDYTDSLNYFNFFHWFISEHHHDKQQRNR